MSIINLPGVALVTGAGQGIGKATALAFAASGVSALILAGRTASTLEATATLATTHATNPSFKTLVHVTDISSEASIQSLIAASLTHFGQIDYAVNNAGYIQQKFAPFAEVTTAEIDRVAGTNQRGTHICCREEVAAMLRQPRRDVPGLAGAVSRDSERGCIVNVSSIAALAAMPLGASYIPTTAGRHAITKAAAVDHAAEGVRVNSLLVGYTATEGLFAHPDSSAELGAKLSSENPTGRMGSAEEAADVIVFLCSPLARYVNGAGLVVDGGKMASLGIREVAATS